jgi:hypothetical protein
MSNIEAIDHTVLNTVVGGADPTPGYNGEDLRNAASGASLGARFGGPLGGVAARDYFSERQRGAELDAKLKAMQNKK